MLVLSYNLVCFGTHFIVVIVLFNQKKMGTSYLLDFSCKLSLFVVSKEKYFRLGRNAWNLV